MSIFKVDLPPEVPAWRQEFNACKNCEQLEARIKALEDVVSRSLPWLSNYPGRAAENTYIDARKALEVKP